jgi:tetratricopeptide (TPR) repeat protein
MCPPAPAQFLPQLQARTPEEFDSYLDVIQAPPELRIERARGFLSAYPHSDLRLRVFETIAETCRARGDAPCALAAASSGLRIAPDYLPLLTLQASVEANTSPAPSSASARLALELLPRLKAPKTVDAATWLRETARLRAENLASLGIAAYKSGHLPEAVRWLEQSGQAQPIPANRFRLAMLYVESKRHRDARRLLEPLASGADPALRDRAASALRSLPQ